MDASRHLDFRVLIFAPIGRDSALTASLLERASIACHVCHSIAEVCDGIRTGAGAVLMTEEALGDANISELAQTLEAQPPWSDISVLLFAGTDRTEAEYRTLQTLEVLRNVTLLDRPVRTTAVVSTVRAALRGRERQYELRDVLVALHTARSEAERARDEAQHANRLKDEFLATLSHELRTPLNAILGWVTLLRDTRTEATKVPRILDIIERNATSQAQLISDVLDVSRMITGRVRLNIQPVQVSRVILDAIDSVKPAAEAKRIRITTDIAAQLAPVAGDEVRLRQVFWNLLSNGIKFTPPDGNVHIKVEQAGESIRVFVTDTGIGIPADFVPFVFHQFRQADQTFTRPHGGLGLGLAIVKHLVELHGGNVSISRTGPGEGTTFEVNVPHAALLQHTAGPDAGHDSVAHDSARFVPADLADQLVLVVEDDESTRELLVAMLTDCGARVAAAGSAVEALRLLDQEVPAIVVADIGMPDQDGLSMMRAIRGRNPERGGRVPAIAVSAYARSEDRAAALTAGFDDFVTKPAAPMSIIRAVEQILSARARQ